MVVSLSLFWSLYYNCLNGLDQSLSYYFLLFRAFTYNLFGTMNELLHQVLLITSSSYYIYRALASGLFITAFPTYRISTTSKTFLLSSLHRSHSTALQSSSLASSPTFSLLFLQLQLRSLSTMNPSNESMKMLLTDLPIELQMPVQGLIQPNEETSKIKMSFLSTKTHTTTSTWLITVTRKKSDTRRPSS